MFCCKNLLTYQSIRNRLRYFSSVRSKQQTLNSIFTYVDKIAVSVLRSPRVTHASHFTLRAPWRGMKIQFFFCHVDGTVKLDPGTHRRRITSWNVDDEKILQHRKIQNVNQVSYNNNNSP
jgi:hypothetical protein